MPLHNKTFQRLALGCPNFPSPGLSNYGTARMKSRFEWPSCCRVQMPVSWCCRRCWVSGFVVTCTSWWRWTLRMTSAKPTRLTTWWRRQSTSTARTPSAKVNVTLIKLRGALSSHTSCCWLVRVYLLIKVSASTPMDLWFTNLCKLWPKKLCVLSLDIRFDQ